MNSKAQVRCRVIGTTPLYQFLSVIDNFTVIFGHKMGQDPYHSSFSVKS